MHLHKKSGKELSELRVVQELQAHAGGDWAGLHPERCLVLPAGGGLLWGCQGVEGGCVLPHAEKWLLCDARAQGLLAGAG